MGTDPRIRTLHLVTSLERRGAEVCAVTLTDRLARDRFQPAIWSVSPVPVTPPLQPARTPVYARIGTGRSGGSAALVHLLAVLREVRPDVIHCHGGRTLKYAIAARTIWRAKAYVYTKIGSIHPWLDAPWRRVIYRAIFERMDAIIAVGDTLRREVADDLSLARPRLVTIMTGVDSAPYDALTPTQVSHVRAQLGLAPADIVLMMVGSLSWEKDPSAALRVIATLASEHPFLKLVYVGDGPLASRLEREVEDAGLRRRVKFLGVRSDVPLLLVASDIVLLTSRTEGLPGVLIEAGMAGRPVVAVDVGAVREVITDGVTGWIVPAGAPSLFAHRVREMVRGAGLRAQMGAAAREYCRRAFGIDRYVRDHENLFADLVHSAHTSSPVTHHDTVPVAGAATGRWD